MQVKIAIGTVAFMLTMMLFGFVALQEPARLSEFTDARLGRSIEKGASLFTGNCATCHGVNGQAEECFNTAGETTGCVGRPLNYAPLLCGSPSQRMEEYGWEGTKEDFIRQTISAGRPGGIMPAWSENFGGPMRDDEVEDITQFVLNWEDEALCGEGVVVDAPEWPDRVNDLPEGDPANGEQLYTVALGCAGCHGDPAGDPGSAPLGPWLGNIAEEGAERKADYTAADYVYESILLPNDFIAPECPNGPCSSPSPMPGDFGTRMSQQDMADVIAFLLGTTEFDSEVEIQYPPSDEAPEFDPDPNVDPGEEPSDAPDAPVDIVPTDEAPDEEDAPTDEGEAPADETGEE